MLALTLMLGACGCGGPVYLARLGWSETRILLRRTPITEVLARSDLPSALRERLAIVLAAREFARDRLGLRVGESYATFAEVTPEEAMIWVVTAARRDRLDLYHWWYPIAGRVPYKGFFDRAAAAAEAQRLGAGDLDTDVRRAVAFSTLGWFADPLLSTTAAAAPVDLVETVLHELFHATVYVPGASAFNESAANMVGHRGAIAFFCGPAAAGRDGCTAARASWVMELRRAAVLGRQRAKLERLYGRRSSPSARERMRAWIAVNAQAELVAHGLTPPGPPAAPNNARLLGELLYLTALDRFDRMAVSDADLPAAIARLATVATAAEDPFSALP